MALIKYTVDELRKLNSVFLSSPSCLEVIKSLHLLRRPPYVHRAVRYKFVYNTNVFSAIPVISCSASQQRRAERKPRPPPANLRNLVCTDSSAAPTGRSASFILQNIRSINNKAVLIHDIITEKKLDFICLTETWQNQQDFVSLNQATPPGYTYIHKPRCQGRGGGLAIIHHCDFQVKEHPVSVSSFECVHLSVIGAAQLQLVLIYRPPKASTSFLPELTELLAAVCPLSPSTILLGDFNIHVDNSNCSFAADFLALLDCFNITQYVHGPTHSKGHTLDLVCSTGSPPLHLECTDLALSDHHAIFFSIPVPHRRQRSLRSITFRNIKNVPLPLLSQTLTNHLTPLDTALPVDTLVEHYNTALSTSLNTLAPTITRSVSFSQPSPWFTSELRLMKKSGRRLERLYKKSGLTVHLEAYRDHVRSYKQALTTAKTRYFSSLINNQQHHPRKLFSTINRLLRPPQSPQPSDAADLCSRFQDFFIAKVNTIHQQLLSSSPATTQSHDDEPPGIHQPWQDISTPAACPPQHHLSCFAPLDNAQVTDLVSTAKPSSCHLDPMPSTLVKACLPTLCNTITTIINTSLQSRVVPTTFKTAAVIPTLKKPGLDPDDPNNYRPISNLPFLCKILERAVAAQLQQHMSHHELFEPLQSGFRAHHSTETALVKITDDLLTAADNGLITILILLDLSAAFDTVSHSILLKRLSQFIGLSGTALLWFHSYLSNRQQFITLNDSRSSTATISHGVPQGSVLGPLLFTIYMLPLGQIIRFHGLNFHCYADDTQLYICTKPSAQLPPTPLTHCLRDIKSWMTENLLKLNSSKTELMVVAPAPLLRKVGDLHLDIDGCSITPSHEVRNLGVILDSSLSFQSHIKKVTKSAFFHLRNISRLRPSLSDTVTETLIHAFISSRLDYCNAILLGLPNKITDRLQYVQNSAARILTGTRPWQHITPILKQLHWLPIKSRITYKVLLLTYKSLHGLGPHYLKDLLHPYSPSRSLRSSSKGQLVIPRTRLKATSDRAFHAAAPSLWNSLPNTIQNATSLEMFKQQLKTHLFLEAFGF